MTPTSAITISSLPMTLQQQQQQQQQQQPPQTTNGRGFDNKQPFNCAGSIFVRITIPMALLMAVSIFLVGVLMGPLWLVCIGVTIAVATMAFTMYLYSIAKKVFCIIFVWNILL